MFASTARTLARRAPFAVAAAAGTSALAHAPQLTVRCDEPPPMTGLRVASSGQGAVPMDVGKKFMKIYFAEHAEKGKIDLHTTLNYRQAENLLTAAGVKAKQVAAMFEKMDTDNSNSVDYVEIVAYFCLLGKGSLQDKVSFFFHACDIDGSNTIEPIELKDIVHHMMLLKRENWGRNSVMQWNRTLYADIPETWVFHMKANEIVHDIFTKASKDGQVLTEKEFQKWVARGGKEVKLLESLFGL